MTPWQAEDGSGALSSVFGIVMFLAFLMFTVQVSVHLTAVSRVGALAFDAATAVARGDDTCDASKVALDKAFASWGGTATCSDSGESVVVRITGDSPASTMRYFGRIFSLDTVNQAAIVRREIFQ